MQAIAKPESKEGWVKFKDNLATPVAQIMSTHKTAFGLGVDDNLQLVKNWTTFTGTEHFKYQQYYKGVKVFRGESVIHINANQNIKSNNNLIRNINLNTTPAITVLNAKEIVVNHIKTLYNEIDSSHADSSILEIELIIENVTSTPELIYIILFHSKKYDLSYTYKINSQTGSIIENTNNKIHFSEELPTVDYDTQTCEFSNSFTIIDSIQLPFAPMTFDTLNYICLYDSTRGDGIEAIHKLYVDSTYFTYHPWCIEPYKEGLIPTKDIGDGTIPFSEHFKFAFQAYWATQNFFDFMLNEYGFTGLNGSGQKITIETGSEDFYLWCGAFFNHPSTVTLDCSYYNSLKVIGHELAHGLSLYSVYFSNFNESVTLNEGFADIYGQIFLERMNNEYNLNIQDSLWKGDENTPEKISNNRSMKNPKMFTDNVHNNITFPDYYKSPLNWLDTITSNEDMGHHNSTVFSHWFYLLSQGTTEFTNGSKTNEVGDTYSFEGIEIDRAADIITEVIIGQHINGGANFHNMRDATIEVALNIDPCSLPALLNAWDCVGVYGVNPIGTLLVNGNTSTNTTIDTTIIFQNLIVESNTLTLENTDFYCFSNTNITVKPTATLVLNNANFYFGKNAGIIVENGGNLILNNDTLTYWDGALDCTNGADSTLWSGIIFEGNASTLLDIDSTTIAYTKNGIQIESQRGTITNSHYINNLAPINITTSVSNSDIVNISNNHFENDASFYPYNTIPSYLIDDYKITFLKIQENINANILDNTFRKNLGNSNVSAVLSGEYQPSGNDSIGNNNLTITGNNFENCNEGVECFYSANATISSNNFTNNILINYTYPINIRSNLNNSIINIKTNNFANFREAISIHQAITNPINIDSNTFVCLPLGPQQNTITLADISSSPLVTINDNSFLNSKKAIETSVVNSLQIDRNNFLNCNDCIYLHESTTSLYKNNFVGNGINSSAIKVFDSHSKLSIDSNTISNFGAGIDLRLCYNDVKITSNIIKDINFNNSLPNKGYGVFMQYCSDFEIKDNEIKDEVTYTAPITIGTGSNGSTTSNTGNNTASPLSFGAKGIVVENANQGNNRILRNNIENVNIGVQTQNLNTELKMKCNTVDANYFGLLVFDELANQGVNCDLDLNLDQQLPGNVWNNPCDPLHTYSNTNRDIMLSTTAQNYDFKYYAHEYGINPSGPLNLRTTPECNNLDQIAGNYIECKGQSATTPQQIMAIDFCSDINIGTGWYKENPTEEIELIEIPQEIIDQLAIKQNFVSDLAVLETSLNDPDLQYELVENINQLYSEINEINSILVELYQMNGNDQIAENLLEQENTVEAKMELVQMYIDEEDFTNASRVLDEIVLMSKDADLFSTIDKQIAYEQNKDYFADIEVIMNNIAQTDRKKSELTESELIDLQQIKDAGLPVSTKAEVLLILNGAPIEDHTIKALSIAEINEMNNSNTTSFDYQLDISPNPAGNSTTINYVLPSDGASYDLKIIDNYQNIGNVAYNATIETGTTSQTVNISNYTVGIYTVVIFRNDLQVASSQLLVVR